MRDDTEQGKRGRVAVLCSGARLASAIEWALRQDGYAVRCGDCGSEALDGLSHDTPDIVLLEARVSDGRGLDICQAIRHDDRLRGVKLLVLQDSGRAVDVRRADALGADAFLPMPFALDDLRSEVGRLSERV